MQLMDGKKKGKNKKCKKKGEGRKEEGRNLIEESKVGGRRRDRKGGKGEVKKWKLRRKDEKKVKGGKENK